MQGVQLTLANLELFATLIGVVLGSIYALSGWSDPGKTDDLARNPRVKNLLWLFGGAVTILLADWKQFAGTDAASFSKAALLGAYARGALPAAFLGPLVIALIIAAIVHDRGLRNPALKGRTWDLILEYLQYGYRAYRNRFDKLEASPQAPTSEALAKIGQSIAPLMAASGAPGLRNDPALHDRMISQALETIENAIKLFAVSGESPTLKSNYMLKVDETALNGATPRFTDGALSAYAGFLVLKRYRDGSLASVVLPVEPPDREDRSLPGAPTTATQARACWINVRKIEFKKGVPKKLHGPVKTFFTGVNYASVLSIPLIRGPHVVGVVNVESSHIDVVGQGPDMVMRINEALGPFCLILGEMVG